MAFLDDLGKKISQTSQDVVQKTKDTADVLKFNAAISDEEKLLADLFRQLGKAYFEKNGDSPEPVLEKIVDAIKSSNKKIEDYRNQIKALKGISTCTVCGADVQIGAAFCSSCGTKVEVKPAPANDKVCTCCGAPLNPNSAFCTNCGTKVVTPKLCPNCGNNVGDAAFCTSCGTKVQQVMPAPVPAQSNTPVHQSMPVENISAQQPIQPTVVQQATNVCPSCKVAIIGNSAFCTNCGTKLTPVGQTTSESAPQMTAKVCPNCNFMVDNNFAFCTNCGTKL